MADIVLVNPPISAQARYGEFAGVGNELPNLGLIYLAAYAREKGLVLRVIDAPALGLAPADVAQIVAQEKPLLAGLTAATVAFGPAVKCAEAIVQKSPNVKLAIGGPHLSALLDDALKAAPMFDFGVYGEGEQTLVELYQAIKHGGDLRAIDGLIFRENDTVVVNGPRALISDLDTLPMPAWDLLPPLAKTYRPSPQSTFRLPSTILFTTRGCPFRCTFCDRSVFGSRVRPHSAKRVFEMMEHLYRTQGIVEFAFHDESVLFDEKRLIELCDRIIDSRLPLSWYGQGRVDQPVSDAALAKMKQAGCRQLHFGVETANDELLSQMKKGTTVAQIEKALEATKRAGISTKAFVMVGLFGETEATLQNTERFILDAPLDDVMITFFTPFPGSEAFEHVQKHGKMIGSYETMNEYEVVFEPTGLTADVLTQARRRMYRRFYFRPRIVAQYAARMRERTLWKLLPGAAWSTIKTLIG